MLVGAQIRAARGLLRWTVEDLAKASSVHYATIMRVEKSEGVPSTNARNIAKIQRALEDAGIEFLNTDSPGVRMKKLPPRERV
jgi:transcriptional regulator with XRE-family HTH domain